MPVSCLMLYIASNTLAKALIKSFRLSTVARGRILESLGIELE